MKTTRVSCHRLRTCARNLAALALVSLFACACASKQNAVARVNSGKVFAVTADKTAFFRYGPQQGNGPDETLAKDTLMTLIRPSFGYCKVHLLPSQQEGYVASEDIQPAPPTLLASLNPPAQASTSSSSSRENFDVRSTEPNFVPPPESLPDPDLPPAAAEPSPQ
ncbi:MAG: hypothetical protein ACR2HH_10665 [Chthoniobacterales bacterium]